MTSIGSPTRSQPWHQPSPIGPSDAIAAATTPSLITRSPWSWKVRSIFIPSPAQPPTSGMPEPTVEWTPRMTSWRSAPTPSASTISAVFGRSLWSWMPSAQRGGLGAGVAQALVLGRPPTRR